MWVKSCGGAGFHVNGALSDRETPSSASSEDLQAFGAALHHITSRFYQAVTEAKRDVRSRIWAEIFNNQTVKTPRFNHIKRIRPASLHDLTGSELHQIISSPWKHKPCRPTVPLNNGKAKTFCEIFFCIVTKYKDVQIASFFYKLQFS